MSKEGDFRLMNGTEFVADHNSVYDWAVGEPNDEGDEDCAHIYHDGLNDRYCEYSYWGTYDVYFYGLCEIKKVANCIA